MERIILRHIILLGLLFCAVCYSQEAIAFPVKVEIEGFRDVIAKTGHIYISGQPDSTALGWLKSQGVSTIVNLRTQPEMDNRNSVPYDEKATIENLGLEYIHIPLGGDEQPYNPQAVKTFAEALENAEGKVLLHCTVAWRASHMWAAYLVQYKNMPVSKAIEHAKVINFGTLPLEGFLGKKLIIDVTD